MRSALFLRDLIWRELTRAWLGDGVLLDRLVQHALPYTSIEGAERASLVEAQKSLREQHSRLVRRICFTIEQGQEAIVLLVDVIKSLLNERVAREELMREFTSLEPSMQFSVEALKQQPGGDRGLPVQSRAAR